MQKKSIIKLILLTVAAVLFSADISAYTNVYSQVYYRGTTNNWGTTAMTLVANNTWETTVTFPNSSSERFKFDVYGNWSLNFGDNNNDGYADQNGGDIYRSNGTYVIRFNDATRQYSVTQQGVKLKTYNQVYLRGTFNNWTAKAMELTDNYTWKTTVTFGGTSTERFKFDIYANWSLNFGDSNKDNYADQNGGDIYVTAGRTYTVTFNDNTKQYSVREIPVGETGGYNYCWYTFNESTFKKITFDVTVYGDPSHPDDYYFQMYQSQINGEGMYFGMQTNVYDPSRGWMGKGLIFSRWGESTLADVRTVAGGWSQIDEYEGHFVGVRINYAWTNHKYRLILEYVESDAIGDWYMVSIADLTTGGTKTSVGQIRFHKSATVSGIHNNGVSWTELYLKSDMTKPCASWHVSIDAVTAGASNSQPTSYVSTYSNTRSADTWYEAATGKIQFYMGPYFNQDHPAGVLK